MMTLVNVNVCNLPTSSILVAIKNSNLRLIGCNKSDKVNSNFVRKIDTISTL